MNNEDFKAGQRIAYDRVQSLFIKISNEIPKLIKDKELAAELVLLFSTLQVGILNLKGQI